MHEASIVETLLDEVRKEVAASGVPGKVQKLGLVVGRLSGANPDALRFAFEVLSRDTVAEDAELVIEVPKTTCYCLQCNAESEIEDIFSLCPACGSAKVRINGSRDLLLTSIELEDQRETT